MRNSKRISIFLTLFLMISIFNQGTALGAKKKIIIPEIKFTETPKTEYTVGDRISFNISAPNYGGKVEYRVILWDDAKKTAKDLWNSSNGYPNRYYTKWQPSGNSIFTLGWIINEPGNYRITVYVKRIGIANNKAAKPTYNCDSFKESVAFIVKPKVEAPVENNQTPTETQPPVVDNNTNTTPGSGAGVIIPPITGGPIIVPPVVNNDLAVEAAGVRLSNGTSINGSLTGNSEYYVDLTSYGDLTGVKTSITVNKDGKLEILGYKFNFIAYNTKIFGPSDFGMVDNDPPGISLLNLRANYSDSQGYYRDTISMTDSNGKTITITIKMKVK